MKILIDNGHGSNTPGKCSPDGRLREWAWTRECAGKVKDELTAKGYDVKLITPETYDVKLVNRVKRVNRICDNVGSKNCVLVSIHNNACGEGKMWMQSSGFSVFVSKNASESSKKLARIFTSEALRKDLMGDRSVPVQKYWTWSWTIKDIYILKETKCPAVLTENMFQDNRNDVDYLLSEEGMNEIVELHVDSIIKYINSL